MAHTPTTRAINHYASEAKKAKNPLLFLQDFAPMHNRWHSTSFRNNLGFLLFHWHVVIAFKKCKADKLWPTGIQPFTLADWTQFGWSYNLAMNVVAGDFDSLASFSSDLEDWHNDAHMAVEMATGDDMMTASTNVFLRNFWRLHYFIDARFLEALAAFDGADSVKKQIARMKKKFHTRLGEV